MSRITVTPADEDEVIVAGAGAAADLEPAPEPVPELVSTRSDAPGEPELSADSGHSIHVQSESGGPANRDIHREQALDDLEAPPMPIAQKIVIVAAVVCIIGALVYYFVAMR